MIVTGKLSASASMGHVVRAPDGEQILPPGSINQHVFRLLTSFIDRASASSSGAALYAFKGIGQMCVRLPELLSRCKILIEHCLHS